MADDNGNIKQSVFYQEMKELRKDISDLTVVIENHTGAMTRAIDERKEFKEALENIQVWKEQTEKRISDLEDQEEQRKLDKESEDRRFIAKIAAWATIISASVTGIIMLIVAIINSAGA